MAKIACPEDANDQRLWGVDVAIALRKAVGLIENADIRERVNEHINAIKMSPEGFIALFNGKDLTGWKRHDGLPGHGGVAGKWIVENNSIVGIQDPPGKGGMLTTLRKFKDFELRLETQIDWPFDSGVFLRVGPHGKSHQVTLDYRLGGQKAA